MSTTKTRKPRSIRRGGNEIEGRVVKKGDRFVSRRSGTRVQVVGFRGTGSERKARVRDLWGSVLAGNERTTSLVSLQANYRRLP